MSILALINKKDNIFHHHCSGSLSVFFLFLLHLSSLSVCSVCCRTFSYQLGNVLLIIDKLQQYQSAFFLFLRQIFSIFFNSVL